MFKDYNFDHKKKPGISAKLDEKLSKFRLQLTREVRERRVEMAATRNSIVIDFPQNLPPRYTTSTTKRDTSQITERERSREKEWTRIVSQANKIYNPEILKYKNGTKLAESGLNTGIIETDLDTGTSREILFKDRKKFVRELDAHSPRFEEREKSEKTAKNNHKTLPYSFQNSGQVGLKAQSQSMMDLGNSTKTNKMSTLPPQPSSTTLSATASEDRARSMEFLLDDSSDKFSHLRPPENTLMQKQQQQDNRQLSEHEISVQKSLTKLNVPDWYKKYSGSASNKTSPLHKKEFGSGTGLAGGWSGLGSSAKTSSLTSLQSTGRYSGSRSHYSSRLRATGPSPNGGISSRESLMSPSSTASASPSPYYERSSFTYGMPYSLARFNVHTRNMMSCGASPASLSPEPSGLQSGHCTSNSTPVSSGPMSRHSYSKQPYLGWRSQERLTSKNLYRTPAERLAADLLSNKSKPLSLAPGFTDNPDITIETSPTTKEPSSTPAVSSDLSLNNSEESNSSQKINRVRSSIKEVSNAIIEHYSKPSDDKYNGGCSPRRGLVWLESSFVGIKPKDSPTTPDTPMSTGDQKSRKNIFQFDLNQPLPPAQNKVKAKEIEPKPSSSISPIKKSSYDYDNEEPRDKSFIPELSPQLQPQEPEPQPQTSPKPRPHVNTANFTSFLSRNEQMEESSPTLEDILDSLLALKPNKKIRSLVSNSNNKGQSLQHSQPQTLLQSNLDYHNSQSSYSATSTTTTTNVHNESLTSSIVVGNSNPISDWQERMNQPLDGAYFSTEPEDFLLPKSTGSGEIVIIQSGSGTSEGDNGDSLIAIAPSSECESRISDFDSAFVSVSDLPEVSDLPPPPSPRKFYEDDTKQYLLSAGNEEDDDPFPPPTPSPPTQTQTQPKLVDYCESADENNDEDAFSVDAFPSSNVPNATTTATVTTDVLPSPARLRRVSFDLDISDKEEKSSSRSRRDESVGGIIYCRNSKCGKSASGLEAKREYKTCHNCMAYYCSRLCRRLHWEVHKKVCMQSRVGALCKQIINHVKEDSFVVSHLSAVAKRGCLAKGRGCVKVFFSSPDRAERFLTGGFPELPNSNYIPFNELLPEEMGTSAFTDLSEQCRIYNMENRFVIYVSVCVVNEVPTSAEHRGAVKWEREMISRSAKVRLLLPRSFDTEQIHHHSASPPMHHTSFLPRMQDDSSSSPPHVPFYCPTSSASSMQEDTPPPPSYTSDENDTLILRSVPILTSQEISSKSEQKRIREVSFANIQKHLYQRGVDLRLTFPEIYTKLCNYVENNEPFLPVTIYPKNSKTGRHFVCVLMPESETSGPTAEINLAEINLDPTKSQFVKTINISEQTYESSLNE